MALSERGAERESAETVAREDTPDREQWQQTADTGDDPEREQSSGGMEELLPVRVSAQGFSAG